jgi:hypothetical protein
MTSTSTALVPTTQGGRYVQQLCKHWAHNLQVELTEERGVVTFPRDARGADWPSDAVVTMLVLPEAIECRIDASVPEQRDGLKDVLAQHLDRFAFREAPLAFDWRDG